MKVTIYNASAGSGKTYRLAYKYVKEVIDSPLSYRNILAVTFTNKVTEEMKSRILRQVVTLASGGNSDYMEELKADLGLSEEQIRFKAAQAQSLILHDYSRFSILTIDTFFQRVLRAFIQEVGIDIGYSLEIENSSILDQAVDELIEQTTHDDELREWLVDSVNERVDEGKGWNIRRDIAALSGQIFNEQAREALAANHSRQELQGVTTRLRSELDQLLEQVVVLAHEAQSVMSSGGVSYNDFKYGSTSAVQIFRRYLNGDVVEPSARSRAACSDISVLAKVKSPAEAVASQIQPLLCSAIELVDRVVILSNTLQLYNDNMRSFALLNDLYGVVERICAEQNTMLLTQTGTLLAEFVGQDDAPFIYEKVGSRYTRFMIDEFQDTSRREWRNFLPLLRNAISQSDVEHEPILIVGDIKQSIYRWRGGDWRLLGLEAQSDLGRRETAVIDMVSNYRSLPRVVGFNNELIERVVSRVSGDLADDLSRAVTNKSISKELYDELSTTIPSAYKEHKQSSPNTDTQSGVVEVVSYDEEPPLIETICRAIDRGYRACEILILTRTGRDAAQVARQLLGFKARNSDAKYNIDVMTQEALIVGASPVSRFIIAVMMLSINVDDTIQRAIYNRFLQRSYLDSELSDAERELFKRLRMLSPIEAFESIIIEYDLNDDPCNIAYLQAIHDQVINFSNSRIGDLSLFVEWWHEKGANRSISVERSESAIEVLTIHKAKGLEKRVVIIPYCDWALDQRSSGVIRPVVWSREGEYFDGSFPVFYRKSMGNSLFAADYHRERVYAHLDSINLLYVALTRAVESLHIFMPSGAKGVAKPILEVMESMGMEREEGDQSVRYRSGDPFSPRVGEEYSDGRQPFLLRKYISSTTELKLSIGSSISASSSPVGQPREVGILLHAAFEGARTVDDLINSVSLMFKNGYINAAEYQQLNERLDSIVQNDYVEQWFSDVWDDLRCESEIVTPKGERLRPDRVMIGGDRCVVVDYKFGDMHDPRYMRQLGRYVNTLQQMGYSSVEGYIWYVMSGEVVPYRSAGS